MGSRGTKPYEAQGFEVFKYGQMSIQGPAFPLVGSRGGAPVLCHWQVNAFFLLSLFLFFCSLTNFFLK